MKRVAPGQLRIAPHDTDGHGFLYLIVGPTEKPGVWHIIRETGDLERWWIDGFEDDPVLSEAE